jgi:hypothetical protein
MIIGGSQSFERMHLEKAIIKACKQCANDPMMLNDSPDKQEFKKLLSSFNIINITWMGCNTSFVDVVINKQDDKLKLYLRQCLRIVVNKVTKEKIIIGGINYRLQRGF